MTETEYWYWLCNIPDMWQAKIKKLIDYFNSPREIYKASEKVLRNDLQLKEADVEIMQESKKAGDEKQKLEALAKRGIRFVHTDMAEYPQRLQSLDDKPYSLYVRGKLPRDEEPTVAIIGARSCTTYGQQMAQMLAKSLSNYGIQTVSGLARGIDSYCHIGSLEADGETFAVLGSGIDVCYPPENARLLENCTEKGGIISEYPLGTKPLGWHFVHRNRIISGLADKIIVIEAKEKSGSLSTVDIGLEQGKDVFALPGRVTDACSKGCNRLIRQGASILTSTDDILAEFQIDKEERKTEVLEKKLMNEEACIYAKIASDSKGIQQLIDETGMEPKTVITNLFRLQAKGLIEEENQRYFRKLK